MKTENDRGSKRVEIGNRIRQERENRKMTREELADRADISPRFLADIEAGIKGMSMDTLCRLSSELEVSLDLIVNGGDEGPPVRNSQIRDMQEMMDLQFTGLDKRGFHCLEDVYAYTSEHKADEANTYGNRGKDEQKRT